MESAPLPFEKALSHAAGLPLLRVECAAVVAAPQMLACGEATSTLATSLPWEGRREHELEAVFFDFFM